MSEKYENNSQKQTKKQRNIKKIMLYTGISLKALGYGLGYLGARHIAKDEQSYIYFMIATPTGIIGDILLAGAGFAYLYDLKKNIFSKVKKTINNSLEGKVD